MTASARRRWLGDVPPGSSAVGDDMHVDVRLVEMAHPCSGHVGDGVAGAPDAEHPRWCRRCPDDTDEHPTAPVRMRCRAAWYEAHRDDYRKIELPDELLEVERFGVFETCSADTTVPG